MELLNIKIWKYFGVYVIYKLNTILEDSKHVMIAFNLGGLKYLFFFFCLLIIRISIVGLLFHNSLSFKPLWMQSFYHYSYSYYYMPYLSYFYSQLMHVYLLGWFLLYRPHLYWRGVRLIGKGIELLGMLFAASQHAVMGKLMKTLMWFPSH